ncbi:hypothetical protein MtrunA17_Chr1g0165471 [Medicago truncatula]|uniref:Uncharacterized protein n=1 Tax=Medicago truncatula TaxID=3880 RepID=A0A396JJM7_MEDTR|nr:hypothetical protein MtrunA17_Chr1g0165471 [Medicago truncatula]
MSLCLGKEEEYPYSESCSLRLLRDMTPDASHASSGVVRAQT